MISTNNYKDEDNSLKNHIQNIAILIKWNLSLYKSTPNFYLQVEFWKRKKKKNLYTSIIGS